MHNRDSTHAHGSNFGPRTRESYLQKTKQLCISALDKLHGTFAKQGFYPYLMISFSDHNRVHIYRCPIFHSCLIIRETFDLNPSFSRTMSVEFDIARKYITNIDTIVYAAVTEQDTNFDTMLILYEED